MGHVIPRDRDSDIPLVGGSRLSLLTIIILSHLLLTDEFPVANPIKHGRNYFVRRLHYAAGEVRSYTLYFPMHRNNPHLYYPAPGPRLLPEVKTPLDIYIFNAIAPYCRNYDYVTLASQPHLYQRPARASARSRYFPISRIFLLIQVDQARR